MQLMTDELRRKLPPLYATEHQGMDALVLVHYFTPDGDWDWYATEFDGKDLFFGLANGFEAELGYFSLSELEKVRGHLGLPVERDLYWTPVSLQKVENQWRQRSVA